MPNEFESIWARSLANLHKTIAAENLPQWDWRFFVLQVHENRTPEFFAIQLLNWRPPRPGPTAVGSWSYIYRGFHGTTPRGVRGIFADKHMRADMKGTRNVYACGLQGAGPAEMPPLLAKFVLHPSKFDYGLCFELKYEGHQHISIKSGGVPAEVEAAGPDGDRCTHTRSGKDNRWTFPCNYTEVVSFIVSPQRAVAWHPGSHIGLPF